MRHPYDIRILTGKLFVDRERVADYLDLDDGTYTVATDDIDRDPDEMVRRAFAAGHHAGLRSGQRATGFVLPLLGEID